MLGAELMPPEGVLYKMKRKSAAALVRELLLHNGVLLRLSQEQCNVLEDPASPRRLQFAL